MSVYFDTSSFLLSLLAACQGVATVAVGNAMLYLWHHFQDFAITTNDKALTSCSGTLPQAALCPTHAFVNQALHLKYLFLLHAFSPSTGLPYLF
jgi:hypothetical protein